MPSTPRLLGLPLLLATLLLTAVLLVAPAGAARPLLGLQTHPLWEGVGQAEADAQLDRAARAGAGLVRVDVGWASLEQEGKGRWSRYHLERLDHVVDAARLRGLKVLLTFWTTPCWASSAPAPARDDCRGAWWERDVQYHPPRDAGDYADALAFLAARYKGRVAAWEVWNEPNQTAFWKAGDPAAAYATLLRRAYPAVKAAAPGTTVVGGALAESDHRFTERLYRLGVRRHFDAWSVHPYSGDRSPLDPASEATHSFVRGVPAVRRVMLRHRDPRPIWLTELGWSTSTARSGPTWANGVAAADQARHLETAFRELRRWTYVRAAVWYAVQDMSDDPADVVGNFGLLRADGTPKPAFAAFQRVALGLRAPQARRR